MRVSLPSFRIAAWQRDLLALFAVAVIARAVVAMLTPFPVPEDTAYYVDVADRLARGEGLTTLATWSFALDHAAIGQAHYAFSHWLPGSTLLYAPAVWLGAQLGVDAFSSAQVISVTLGALLAPLLAVLAGYAAGEQHLSMERGRSAFWLAGLLAALWPPLLIHSALPDSTTPFAVATVAAALVVASLLRRPASHPYRDWRPWALGISLGLDAWIRHEAILLAIVVAIVASVELARGWRETRWLLVRSAGIACIALAAMVAPLVALQFLNGGIAASSALQNAWFVRPEDLFAYASQPTAATYFALPGSALLAQRGEALWFNGVEVLILGALPLVLFAVPALPRLLRLRSTRALSWTALLTFLVITLAFPVSSLWGTFLHAAGAAHATLIVGTALSVEWAWSQIMARRHWRPASRRLLPWVSLALLLPAVLLVVGHLALVSRQQQVAVGDQSRLIAAMPAMESDGASLLLTHSPIWVAGASGYATAPIPTDGEAGLQRALRELPVARIMVDRDRDAALLALFRDDPCVSEVYREGATAIFAVDRTCLETLGDTP